MTRAQRETVIDVDEPADKMPPLAQPEVWWALDKRKRKDGSYYAVSTPLNVTRILSADSRWFDRIRWNEFTGEAEIQMPTREGAEPARPLSDVIATRIVHWLDQHYGIVVAEERVGRECNAIADRHPYHPIRDYLRGLKWDGRARMEMLLAGYMTAPDTELNRVLSRSWMISAVARAMKPGCKVDTTLVLVGGQGAGKSTALRALGGAWTSDTLLDFQSKDLYESLHGVWIYELAELDGFRRADWTRIKAMISSPEDRYRRPYAKGTCVRLRSCVFSGTTNEQEFLGDPTGSRRFWPVALSATEGARIDVAAIERDRDQLWAEAVAAYDAGIPWWLDAAQATELRHESEQFQARHPWYEPIAAWLDANPGPVSIHQALTEAIRKPLENRSKMDETHVATIFQSLGLEKVGRPRKNGRREHVWAKR